MKISLKNVCLNINEKEILKNINLSFEQNKFHLVIGPSGSGKSSLLRILNALIEPTKGSIFIDNHEYSNMPTLLIRKKVGMIFQKPVLFEGSVYDNLIYGLRLHRLRIDKSYIKKVLKDFDIPEEYIDYSAEILSVGEQQRISIVRTLLINPDIILCDEPVSALDPQRANKVLKNIYKVHKDYGKTIIMVSHIIKKTLEIADYIYYIDKGELMYSGTSADLKKNDNLKIKNFIEGVYD